MYTHALCDELLSTLQHDFCTELNIFAEINKRALCYFLRCKLNSFVFEDLIHGHQISTLFSYCYLILKYKVQHIQ